MRHPLTQLFVLISSIGILISCSEQQPVRTVSDFVKNPMMLEAAMVRCSADRVKTRYDAECLNARQAVGQIEAKEESARRAELESRSDSKRQALRRAQEAAAEARRRVVVAEKRRQEAEYLAQFGVAPPANLPADESATATDGGNAPAASTEMLAEGDAPDLSSVRDESQRGNEQEAD